jgi:hypothetical protein
MTPRHAGQILSWLSQREHKKETEVEVWSVQLWPRFAVDGKSTNEYTIEPDLIVDGCMSEEPFRWIIEVKWDAELHRHQIEDQVRLCTNDQGRWAHISLVKSAELAAFELRETAIIQWNEVLRRLGDVLRSNAADGASLVWCKDAIAFLEKLGVGTFEGFGHLDLAPVTVESFGLSIKRQFSLDGLIDVGSVNFSLRLDGVDHV